MKKRIPIKKHLAKNNNLDAYRQKLVVSNEALVIKCIAHIRSIEGEIKFSTVSRVSYGLANTEEGQSGLTLAAISKNPVYRLLVEQAQADTSLHQTGKHYAKANNFSKGDLKLTLYGLQSANTKLKQEKKILELKLKEVSPHTETVTPIRDEIIENANALRNIAKSIVTRILELELAYIDTKDDSIKLMHYESVLVTKDALNKFFEKELANAKL